MKRSVLPLGFIVTMLWSFTCFDHGLAQAGSGLGSVTLESMELKQTDLATALEFLAAKAEEAAPSAPPANFLLIDSEGTHAKREITMKLKGVPWATALKYVCELAQVTARGDGAVILIGTKEEVDRMILQRQKIQTGVASEAAQSRLASMVVESVAFDQASLEDVAEYVRLTAQAYLQKESRGGAAGTLNVLIKENPKEAIAPRRVSMNLKSISMSELLHCATGLANCRFRIDARAVVIGEAADLARPPGGPRKPSGAIFNQLAAKTIDSIDIPAGSQVPEFLEVVRSLGGVNGINMSKDAVAASRLAMHQVTVLELLRYYNEISGTAYRLDPNAFIISDDPDVPVKPKPPVALQPRTPAGTGPAGLGFDP
ncbi:MAG: hypothetical protein KDN20_08650 [Verrucomicrobiae bacterium]|nr:hypothetical protein [Verrucomicrobiae bacterium]